MRTVVEPPELRVMEEPGSSVWLEITYWDWAFGVIVLSPMVIGAGALAGGVGRVRGDVAEVVAGNGEGMIMMFSDAGARGVELTGSSFGDGTRKIAAGVGTALTDCAVAGLAGSISCACESSAGAACPIRPPDTEVISVGKSCGGFVSVGEGSSAGGAFDVGTSPGAFFSVGDCVLSAGTSIEVGPSSGSVDVEVFVIYNAVCNAIAGKCIYRGCA